MEELEWEEGAAAVPEEAAGETAPAEEPAPQDSGNEPEQEGPTGPQPAETQEAGETLAQAAADEARNRLGRDLEELRGMDPEITGLEALSHRPEYRQIVGYVEKGLRLPEAYRLVCFDRLQEKAAEAARQAALNSVNGKRHLQATGQLGLGAAAVPPEVAEEYRMLLPEVSDAEIRAHYNRYAGK